MQVGSLNIYTYLARSAAAGGLGIVLSSLTSLALIPLIVHQIGIQTYGTWALLGVFAGLAPALDLGLSRALIFYIGRPNGFRRYAASFWTALSAMLVGAISIALVATLIVMALRATRPGYALHSVGFDESLFVGGSALLATGLLSGFFRAFLEVTLRVHLLQTITYGFQAINMVAIYVVSQATSEIAYLVATTCIVFAFSLFVLAYVCWHIGLPVHRFNIRHARRILKILIARGLGYLLLGAANVAALPFNRVLVTVLGGATAHGYFDIAAKIALAATALLQAVNVPLFGILVRQRVSDSRNALSLARKMTYITSFLYSIGLVLLLATSGIVAQYFTNGNSERLELLIVIMVAGIGFTGLSEPATRLMWACGLERRVAATRTIALLLNVALIPALDFLDADMRVATSYVASLCIASIVLVCGLFLRSNVIRHSHTR